MHVPAMHPERGGAFIVRPSTPDPIPATAPEPQVAASPAPDELLELLRRERADFLNYKRRLEGERATERERVRAEVVEQLLPLLDELDIAMAKLPEELRSHPWARGVALSRSRIIDTLRRMGVERVGQRDEPFDPTVHEALFFDPRPGATERRISEVIRPGYRLGGRLLRPAQVGVVGPADEGGNGGDVDGSGSRGAAPAEIRPEASTDDDQTPHRDDEHRRTGG
jgi:molecular chaperone GrpE